MTRLSVNINKVATLRNARGKNTPNLLQVAKDCERFGGQGITVHPRPDERHIRYADVHSLKGNLTTEFNIEGYPSEEFMDLVLKVRPHQVTLVPDAPDAITSNAGWDTITHADFLASIIERLHQKGIRVSIFVDPDEQMIDGAANIGTDRVELFTEAYAEEYPKNPEQAIAPYLKAAQKAKSRGLRINAGHDLSLENLHYFVEQIPFIDEVSIGHALISDALYMGLEATIKAYREALVVEERPAVV